MKRTMSWMVGVSMVLLACAMSVAETPTLDTDATPRGTEVLVYELHGGTWHDAEKDFADGGYEDGYMCWAATASNMLTWGGWDEAGELADEDEVFEHFQTHWKSVGGDPFYAILWWFQGGMEDSGGRKAPGGGAFYPEITPWDYISGPHTGTRGVPERLRDLARDGYVCGVRVAHPEIRFWHSVTCWGVNVDPETDEVLGLWITDSDDDPMGDPPRKNYLRYFEIEIHDGRTYVQGYAGGEGTKAYYIDEVVGLASRTSVVEDGPDELVATAQPEQTEVLASLTPRSIAGIAMIIVGLCVVIALARSRASAPEA
jgi:hypothetical protein